MSGSACFRMGKVLPRGGGQARPGAEAQQKSVDGCELLAFLQVGEEVLGQAVRHVFKAVCVFPLMDLVQLRADVVGVEPEHEVGHMYHLSISRRIRRVLMRL